MEGGEQGGGDGEDQPRPPLSHRDWTPNGTVKCNMGQFGEKEERKGHRRTETTIFFYKVHFFPRRCHVVSRDSSTGRCPYFGNCVM